MPSAPPQSAVQPSWNPARPVSNVAASATASPSVTRLTASATRRARLAALRGTASSTSAPTRGVKIVAVSSTGGSPPLPDRSDDEDRHEDRGAAEHADRVGPHQPALDPAAALGAGEQPGRDRVDPAVDRALVHVDGQERGQRPAARDREELVQLVDVHTF